MVRYYGPRRGRKFLIGGLAVMRRCESFFQAFHPGLDIANAEYTPIHAAAAGVVVWAGLAVPGDDHGSYGNCVIIKHNDHISTLYAHMDDQIHPLEVRVGDVVQQGQVIGYEGMTGLDHRPAPALRGAARRHFNNGLLRGRIMAAWRPTAPTI